MLNVWRFSSHFIEHTLRHWETVIFSRSAVSRWEIWAANPEIIMSTSPRDPSALVIVAWGSPVLLSYCCCNKSLQCSGLPQYSSGGQKSQKGAQGSVPFGEAVSLPFLSCRGCLHLSAHACSSRFKASDSTSSLWFCFPLLLPSHHFLSIILMPLPLPQKISVPPG